MKKRSTPLLRIGFSLIAALLVSFAAVAAPETGVDCSITKPNGDAGRAAGYSTTLTSVTLNSDQTYTIVLTIYNSGIAGSNNKTLSDLCVQPGAKNIITASYKVISGSLQGTLDLTTANPAFPKDGPGFKIAGCSQFGDGYKGTFTVTYTIPLLDVQQVACKAGTDLNIVSFSVDELNNVMKCGLPKAPVFLPAPGTYNGSQTVSMASPTDGVIIYYTTDGSIPSSTNGTRYTAPVTITSNTTFKAIAYNGVSYSDVATGAYVIIATAPLDSDGDGVIDTEDDYPNDPTRAYNNVYPATGYGSLAFEDNWPFKADYDMNDMVVDYSFNQVRSATNNVVEIKAKFILRAMGATFHNGFGFELPVAPSQVASCVVKFDNGQSVPMGNLVNIDPATGLELNQAKAVVILFDDGFNVLPQNYGGIGVNTTPGLPWTAPRTINVTITFKPNVSGTNFTNPVYNPFIFANQKRGQEIHLPDNPPTSLADKSLFNTGEDNSNATTGRYYKTSNNLPWALNIYDGYEYPNEKVSILDAFTHFAEWAESGGTLYPDWYKKLDGYRNNLNIFVHP